MQYAVVNNKGQVTIPMDIRNALGIHQKDKMRFELSGKVIMISPAQSQMAVKPLEASAKKLTLEGLRSILPKPSRSYTIEEMNEAIGGKV